MTGNRGYHAVLRVHGFQALLWTHLLGTFNGIVLVTMVSIAAAQGVAEVNNATRNLALRLAILTVPLLLLATYAGNLADRFSKTRVIQATKAVEICAMLLAVPALLSGRIDWLLAVLLLLVVGRAFVSPTKQGMLPEMVDEARIVRANALLQTTNSLAIAAGIGVGALIHERWAGTPFRICGFLIAISTLGFVASLRIPKVRSARKMRHLYWNALQEIGERVRPLGKQPRLAMAVLGICVWWFAGALILATLLLGGRDAIPFPGPPGGLLLTALAAGMGAGSVAAGLLSGEYIELGLLPIGAGLIGLFSFLAGLPTHDSIVVACLMAVGFGSGLFLVPLQAYLQKETAAEERGRILALSTCANMVGVILASGVVWLNHNLFAWKAAGVISALGGLVFAGALFLVLRMPEPVLRFALWCLAHMLFRIRIEGYQNIPDSGAALLVSNHISYADPVLVGCASRKRCVRFLMWQPIYNIPVANRFFRILKTIPVDGGSPKSTIRALRSARAELAQRELVAIFPEGGISYSGETAEFERGFEKMLQGSSAPVIPIRIHGLYGHPLSYKGGGPFRSWQKLWRPVVSVRIGEPIYGLPSTSDLRQAVLSV